MKKLFIILTGEPLTYYYFQKFSFLKNKDKNITIKVWNILPIFDKRIYNKYYPAGQHRIYQHKNFKNIKNYSMLKKELENLPNSFLFYNHAPKIIKSLLLVKLLSFKGGKKINIQLGGIPRVRSSFINKIKFRIRNFSLLTILKIILMPITILISLIKKSLDVKPILFFVPNKYWFNKIKAENNISKIVKINDHEYEMFKKKSKLTEKENLIVFIDEMKDKPMDHDLYWYYPKSLEINSKDYWNKIDNFLSKLKIDTGLKPVIAAAHRRGKNDVPIKKEFIFNKTAELIKKSKLVVAHSSTAIHYAVLFKKPIVLLNLKEFKHKLTNYLHVKKWSELLDCKIINLEEYLSNKEKFLFQEHSKVNKKKYRNFINNYLVFKNSRNIKVWDEIIYKLKKIKLEQLEK